MKVTKSQLKRIIKEELENVLEEQDTELLYKIFKRFKEYAQAHGGQTPDDKTFKRAFDAARKAGTGATMTVEEGKLAKAFFGQFDKVKAWEKSAKKQSAEPTPAKKPAPTPSQEPAPAEKPAPSGDKVDVQTNRPGGRRAALLRAIELQKKSIERLKAKPPSHGVISRINIAKRTIKRYEAELAQIPK